MRKVTSLSFHSSSFVEIRNVEIKENIGNVDYVKKKNKIAECGISQLAVEVELRSVSDPTDGSTDVAP